MAKNMFKKTDPSKDYPGIPDNIFSKITNSILKCDTKIRSREERNDCRFVNVFSFNKWLFFFFRISYDTDRKFPCGCK